MIYELMIKKNKTINKVSKLLLCIEIRCENKHNYSI